MPDTHETNGSQRAMSDADGTSGNGRYSEPATEGAATTGAATQEDPLPSSSKIHVEAGPGVRVPVREIALSEGERQIVCFVRALLSEPAILVLDEATSGTAKELYDIWRANPDALVGNDYLPTTGWWLTYRRAWQRLDEGWKNIAVAFAPPGGVVLPASAAGVVLWRRRKRGVAP